MGTVLVDDEGLQALAAQCSAISAELAQSPPAATPGPPNQSTSAAIAHAGAAINVATAAMARRVEMTGLKVATAGRRYVAEDDGNAQQISSAGQSIQI